MFTIFIYLYIMKNMFSSYQTKLIPICITYQMHFFSICTYNMRATTFIYSFHVHTSHVHCAVRLQSIYYSSGHEWRAWGFLGRDNVVSLHTERILNHQIWPFSVQWTLKYNLTQREMKCNKTIFCATSTKKKHKINSKNIVITLMFRFLFVSINIFFYSSKLILIALKKVYAYREGTEK